MTTQHVGGVRSEDYWDFQPGEHVMTIDGFPGVVEQVEDGPIAGAENYVVKLDNGMGGGNYSASMLAKMPTSRSAAGVHLAVDDYPELGGILDERPDPGKMTFTAALSEERQEADAEDHDEPGGNDGPSSCSYCGSTDFQDLTDNGRVRQATCATCGGTMSAHEGAQWTPELIGDPSNHPSPAIDPRSGASPGGQQAGINDFIDFDSRVSTTAAADHLDLYHRTSPEAAEAINRDKTMTSKENTGETYWSTFRGDEPDAQAAGYGHGVVHIRVPHHLAEIDDEFPSGEEHYRVHPGNLQPHHFVEGKLAAKIPSATCATCKGKGTVSWSDVDPDWEGDPDENPGKTHTAPCDDCGGKGSTPETSDEELATARKAFEDRLTKGTEKHVREKHPAGKLVTIDDVRGCGPRCPVGKEWDRRGKPFHYEGVLRTLDPEPGAMLRTAARDKDLGFHITASWADVQRKAKRIRAEGGVTIVVASNDGIGGHVKGDHGTYEALLVYRPGTHKVADWTCGCKWAAYAFERSPGFKRFEGRKCSHALALQFEAQSQGMFGKEVHPSEPTSRERSIVRYDPDEGAHVFARPYEGSLVSTLVARLRDEDADPAEVVGHLVRAGVRHRTAVLLWKGAYHEENAGTLIPVKKAGYRGLVDAYEGHHDEMNEMDRQFDPEEAERNEHPDVKPVGHHTPVINMALRTMDNDLWKNHAQVEKIDHGKHDTYATQPYVTRKHLDRYIHNPDDSTQDAKRNPGHDLPANQHPLMVRHEGNLFALEGHHRIAANMATGRPTHALVYDADKHGFPERGEMDYEPEHHGLVKYAGKQADCDFDIPDEKQAAEHALRHHDDGICTLTERKRGRKHKKLSAHEEGGERRCPHCGGFIGVEAVEHHHCPHCGAPLGGEAHHHEGAKQRPPGPHVSGIALKAHDTGRVLMLQRGLDDEDDPAAGTWEFPGGHHEDGDRSSLHAGIREWEEEVGQEFPLHGAVKHVWSSPDGVYQGHVVVIPSEKDLSMKDGRVVPNPDDPKGDSHEQAAWWDPEHARKIPNLRDEVKAHTPWKEIAKASLDTAKAAAAWDPISNVNPQPGRGTSEPAHSNTTNPASTGWAAGEDPDNWNNLDANPEPLTPSLGFDAMLHGEPEPALPTTYGDEDATMRPMEATPADLDPIPDNPPAQVAPDQDTSIHLLNGGSSLPNTYHASAVPETQEVADVIAAFQRTAAGQELLSSASKADDDIAAAAKAHLAKEAAAKFDFAEQQELINEGNDGRKARNLGDLKIEGTHYELLEAALAHQDTDSSDLFV